MIYLISPSSSSPPAEINPKKLMGLTSASNKLTTIYLFLSFLLLLLGSFLTHSTAAPSFIEIVGSRSVIGVGGGDDSDKCVYTVYVRTGSIWKGGTDSVISVELAGSDGYGVRITDLEAWGGLMEEGHNYFERGNLDVFSGLGPCMASPPCLLNLTSDGTGTHHGWYCNYIEVTTTGPHSACAQQLFTVEQWLATDTSPYRLYALRDYCSTARPMHRPLLDH